MIFITITYIVYVNDKNDKVWHKNHKAEQLIFS